MPETQDVNFKKTDAAEHNYGTGAHRDNRNGKGAFKWIPQDALFLVSRIYELGNLGRGWRNWEYGMTLEDFLDSAMRHLSNYLAGDRAEPHLPQACWNILCAIQMGIWVHLGIRPSKLNNLPDHRNFWFPGDPAPTPLSPMEIEWLKIRNINPASNGAAAYLAGIVDGEGTISVSSSNKCYIGYVSVFNNSRGLLERLQQQFGGGSISQTCKGDEKWAASYALEWGQEDSARILPQIIPFLVLKRKQAEVVMKLNILKSSGAPAEELLALKQECHRLNKKGPKPDAAAIR